MRRFQSRPAGFFRFYCHILPSMPPTGFILPPTPGFRQAKNGFLATGGPLATETLGLKTAFSVAISPLALS